MTTTFHSRTRAQKAMRGGKPDRVPCVPLIDLSYAAKLAGAAVSACFLNPVRHAQALAAALERHPDIDGLSVNLCLAKDVIAERQETAKGYRVKTVGGITWNVPYDDVGSPETREIRSFDDPRLETDDPFMPGIVQTFIAIPSGIRRRYLINAGVTGPFSQVALLMGLDKILTATLTDAPGLRRAIEKRLPLALEWIDALAALDPGAIWIGEGPASGSLIGPDAYRDFVAPYERLLAERIRGRGIPSVLHICGKLGPLLEIVPESGCDCLELDWPEDMRNAKARIGRRMALKGNLNTTTLLEADPSKVYELSAALIDEAGEGGAFVLSSGCCLGRDTPPENVDAMARAALDHGRYGLDE
ncbi:MAG TPA: uroporphyrinogen decarboxylase family protein [Sumerlaeia bacterium]|nr:uroporphyrinogen decarboxylase family protein [Sumerlaeia bacterium]